MWIRHCLTLLFSLTHTQADAHTQLHGTHATFAQPPLAQFSILICDLLLQYEQICFFPSFHHLKAHLSKMLIQVVMTLLPIITTCFGMVDNLLSIILYKCVLLEVYFSFSLISSHTFKSFFQISSFLSPHQLYSPKLF